jgi:hypothetical protein
MSETCWRCGADMEWRHGTWQCGRCTFKLGCCEGEPQTACDMPAASVEASRMPHGESAALDTFEF